jgi:hypothetical protein
MDRSGLCFSLRFNVRRRGSPNLTWQESWNPLNMGRNAPWATFLSVSSTLDPPCCHSRHIQARAAYMAKSRGAFSYIWSLESACNQHIVWSLSFDPTKQSSLSNLSIACVYRRILGIYTHTALQCPPHFILCSVSLLLLDV